MKIYGVVVAAVFSLGFLVYGCGAANEYSFHERCDGEVRQICGDGHDQQVGREIRNLPCPSETPVCVEEDERTTYCVADEEEESCGDDFQARCEGQIGLSCQDGQLRGIDCDWPPTAGSTATMYCLEADDANAVYCAYSQQQE